MTVRFASLIPNAKTLRFLARKIETDKNLKLFFVISSR